MRTEQEIRESLAEMERMAESAERILVSGKANGIPFLEKQFELWKHRSLARVSILKWVLGLPYLKDEPPDFTE